MQGQYSLRVFGQPLIGTPPHASRHRQTFVMGWNKPVCADGVEFRVLRLHLLVFRLVPPHCRSTSLFDGKYSPHKLPGDVMGFYGGNIVQAANPNHSRQFVLGPCVLPSSHLKHQLYKATVTANSPYRTLIFVCVGESHHQTESLGYQDSRSNYLCQLVFVSNLICRVSSLG